ncbi:MAG: hypothetical protein DI601_00125 [Azospirillum brasilense]|nr:MAG: hypothetical protein DI601_00125 [Azospirillum brasilense]
MDWTQLQVGMPHDRDLPPRARRIGALTRVLKGELYDHIGIPFSVEVSPANEYIPLHNRRPAVKHHWPRVVVDDSVALLFGNGRFPTIQHEDEKAEEALIAFAKAVKLPAVMTAAATTGSVGSVAVLFRVLKGKPRLSVLETTTLTPTWDPEDPDELLHVTERYRISREQVLEMGYQLAPAQADIREWWFQRRWTRAEEQWFIPWPTSERDHVPVVDPARTVRHGLGFVPVVWVRNLSEASDAPDGPCTFELAIDTTIEADYQMSQSGRGLRYASDPKLVIRDPGGEDRPIAGGAANAIIMTAPDSEAKFLEISGSAAAAVLEHVQGLRRVAMEAIHGSRIDPEKSSGSQQSGKALEILESPLIALADKLRTSYGEGCLTQVLRMFCAASRVMPITVAGETYTSLDPHGISLIWPRWFPPSAEERQADATTVTLLTEKRLMQRKTAVANIGPDYDIKDPDAELAGADADQAAADARDASLAATMEKPKPKGG